MLIPNLDNRRYWIGDPIGLFSCKAFFESLIEDPLLPSFKPSLKIWKAKVSLKLQVCTWIIAHDKVSTNEILQKRRPNFSLQPQ